MRLPLDVMREQFGGWAAEAEAIDDETTRWPIRGESFETMLTSVMWIPAGVEYTLHGSPEFLAFAAETAARMRSAVPANSPLSPTPG